MAIDKIVSFSGGKDSTAMLLMMIEKGMQIDNIVFVDTTKEFPQMLEHIDRVEKYIAPLKIERRTIDFDYWFSKHVKTKGKNIGSKGYGWPGPLSRWCTRLKITQLSKYKGVHYVGIAADEFKRIERAKKSGLVMPLVDWGVTETDALEYCYKKGFDWGGLYKVFRRVSCWCCPLQRISELRKIYNQFPDIWMQLKDMDKNKGNSIHKFTSSRSLDDFEKMFREEKDESFYFEMWGK